MLIAYDSVPRHCAGGRARLTAECNALLSDLELSLTDFVWTFEPAGKCMADLLRVVPRERGKRFREFAREARAYAAKSPDAMRSAFLEIAGHWDELARSAEAADGEFAGIGVPAISPPTSGLAEPDGNHIYPTEQQ